MLRTVRTCFGFAVQSYNPSKNYYKVLNVEESATPDRIKASFKSLAKRYHPDFNKGKEEEFKQINEAYQVLSDEATKQEYDAARQGNQNHDSSHPYRQQNQYPGSEHQSHGFARGQPWQNQANPRQRGYYQRYYQGPNGYTEFYSSQSPNNPNSHPNPGQFGGWGTRDQWLFELYRKQQEDFLKQYHQSQRDRFERAGQSRGRSPIEEQYMRRFMEDLMAREEARMTKEELREEQEEEARREKERLQREYAENARKLKAMGRVVVQDIKDFAKSAWNAWLDFKGKK